MKNLYLFMFITLLLISSTLFAQKGEKGVVYLKNGSVVRGSIISQQPDGPVRIKTNDNSIWVFEQATIDSITKKNKLSSPFKTGYFNLTEIGVLAGNSDNAYSAPFTFMNINGWQFSNGSSAGIGVGVEFLSETYLPVVADFRYYLRKQGVMPFFSAQGGYNIALENADKQYVYDYGYNSRIIWPGPTGEPVEFNAVGGWLANPSAGIYTPLGDNLALTISAGYRWMRLSYNRDDDYKLDVDYNRLSLKVGLLFK